jgi:hypothetical protein
VTASELQSLTNTHVVSLSFVKKTDNKLRRMTCTTCLPLLESQEGLLRLRYRKPSNKPPYNPLPDNVIVWDIDKRDFRQIPAPRVRVNRLIKWQDYLRMLGHK